MSSVCQPRCPFRSTACVVTPAVSKHRAEGGCENSPVRSYLHRFLGGRAVPVSEATQARQVRPTGLYHQRPVPFRPPPRYFLPVVGRRIRWSPRSPAPGVHDLGIPPHRAKAGPVNLADVAPASRSLVSGRRVRLSAEHVCRPQLLGGALRREQQQQVRPCPEKGAGTTLRIGLGGPVASTGRQLLEPGSGFG